MNVKKWLTEEERITYALHTTTQYATGQATSDKLIAALESLSAERELSETRRVLLAEIDAKTGSDGWVLLTADDLKKIHAALKGVGE